MGHKTHVNGVDVDWAQVNILYAFSKVIYSSPLIFMSIYIGRAQKLLKIGSLKWSIFYITLGYVPQTAAVDSNKGQTKANQFNLIEWHKWA